MTRLYSTHWARNLNVKSLQYIQFDGKIALKCLYCYCGPIVNSSNVFKLRKSNKKLKKPKKNINCLVVSVGLNQWFKPSQPWRQCVQILSQIRLKLMAPEWIDLFQANEKTNFQTMVFDHVLCCDFSNILNDFVFQWYFNHI